VERSANHNFASNELYPSSVKGGTYRLVVVCIERYAATKEQQQKQQQQEQEHDLTIS